MNHTVCKTIFWILNSIYYRGEKYWNQINVRYINEKVCFGNHYDKETKYVNANKMVGTWPCSNHREQSNILPYTLAKCRHLYSHFKKLVIVLQYDSFQYYPVRE